MSNIYMCIYSKYSIFIYFSTDKKKIELVFNS